MEETTVEAVNDTLIRWGGSRAVASLILKIVVVLLLVVGAPLLALWPFGRTHAPSVEVHDEAGVLQVDGTTSALEKLRFREDVTLVVVTLDAGYNSNFNSEVLAYARKNHPEWISASDPNYWADGLVILGVSPSGRWVGCYFGEDVKVDSALQRDIQDAGKKSFGQGRWAPGVEQMAARAADVMGRPIGSDLAVLFVSAVGVIGGLILAGAMIRTYVAARAAFAGARRHYAQVTTDYDATQIRAGLIPTNDAHGAQVLARFAWFEDRYGELTRNFHAFGEPRGAQWFEVGRRSKAKRLLDLAGELDSLDDAISNAAALLTLSEGWQDAWRNEQGPVQEDLASLQNLCSQVAANSRIDVARDRNWARESSNRLAAMTNELSRGALTPSAALDELDFISREVRSRADALAQRALEADSSSHREQRMRQYQDSRSDWGWESGVGYSGSWSMGGHHSSYNPASTIRINPASPGAQASGVRWSGAGSSSQFSSPISGLVTGYSSAATWTPPSSSSSSSGSSSSYSGGGGFSGAGSSSHF